MSNRLGQQLGNYRLTQLLGQGGFADVYLGEHVYLKSHAALKVLHTQLSEKDAASFVLEAQTLARLSHPHIVRVLDFAVQDGTPFLVMEYASQGTLRQRHTKGTRLPLETVIHYVQQVAAALQYAHNQRLMHLDVKPENMLLNERTDVLLSDFGLSMFAPHTLSQSIQEMAGTVFYMAPEQIQGKPRLASDQYALGVIAYEWLCGRRPFTGSLLETATQHLTKPPPSLREHMPNLSPAIEKVVLRALAKESKQRFASVQDFATALQYAAQGTSSPHAMSLPTTAPVAVVGSPFLTAPAAVVEEHSSSKPVSVPALVPSSEGQVPQDTLRDSKQEWQELTPSKSLIGRTSEWAQLMAAWWSASAGQPHLLVLSGEAGIGKTRLAEALLSEIGRQGIATAIARCYAVEDELAYTPVVSCLRAEAVRPALAALDSVWLTEVARLLPDLLIERPGLPPPSPLQEDWQRQRLFEALARALLGTHGPLLLLLDDLQWCDRETLVWVHYLLRFDPHARLLIVGTLRAEERSTNRPLESLLVNLRREGQVSEIPLGPLDATETATLAKYVVGQALSPELAAKLYQETEGNPLFVVETMRMGVAGHAELEHPPGELAAFSPPALSPTIQGVIAARLEQLSPSARELVNMAAVIGRAFTFELLTAAIGRNDEAVVEALDELVQRRIIREQGIEGYNFSHDKLREGAYTALSRARRRLIHRRVAEALETVYGDTREHLAVSSPDVRLADLAYHFFEAGVWAKALEYGQRAGEQAQRLYTPHITIEQVTRSLDAAQHAAILPPATLYRLRGQAYETLGDFERARLDYETTLQMAHVANNLHGEWQALMDLGFLWTQRDYAQAGISYQQALALARQMDDPKTLAHSLNRLGNWHVNIEQPREALRYHQEALTLFQQAHESHGLAETYDLLGMASYLGGDLIQGTTYYQQAIALFRELGDQQGLTSSLATLTLRGPVFQTDSMVSAAGLAEVFQDTEHALRIAREIEHRSAEAYASFMLGLCLGSQGEYERALAAARQSLDIAEEIEHRQWQTSAHTVLGGIYGSMLAYPQAREHFEQALALSSEIGSLFWKRIATGYLVSAAIALHDFAQAETVLHTALNSDTPAETMAQRLVWCAAVELALVQGYPARALEIINQLSTSGTQGAEGQNSLRVLKLRGEALVMLQRPVEAEVAFETAQEIARAQGVRPMQWRICIALGNLYQAQGRNTEAEQTFAIAQTRIEELAANVPDEPEREKFLRQAMAMLPHLRSLSPDAC